MPHYLSLGSLPRKRHIAHRVKPGYRNEGIYYEEVVSTQGFSRAHSIVYHMRPPTRVKHIEPAGGWQVTAAELPVLRHVHLKTKELPVSGDPIRGRVAMFTNSDVTVYRCRPAKPQEELFRNAVSEEIVFIHHGSGRLLTQFGVLSFKPYDYVVIPRCTTYQLEFDAGVQPDLLVIESPGSIGFPSRYLNPDGQFRLGAPFCERDLHGPSELLTIDKEQDTPVLIKDGAKLSRYVLANHPFDAVGWDGMVYPFTFNADDFEPITGTIHQPPPIHQTFESEGGFVVCTFAPRMLDHHPDAIKVPYAHSNVQSDEVLYYVRGNFGSRRGVELGSFTLHPHGIPHGPHPGTIVASRNVTRTDELAVMVDTFRPLHVATTGVAYDDPNYPFSWKE